MFHKWIQEVRYKQLKNGPEYHCSTAYFDHSGIIIDILIIRIIDNKVAN